MNINKDFLEKTTNQLKSTTFKIKTKTGALEEEFRTSVVENIKNSLLSTLEGQVSLSSFTQNPKEAAIQVRHNSESNFYKSTAKIVKKLPHLRKLGWKKITFSESTLTALSEWLELFQKEERPEEAIPQNWISTVLTSSFESKMFGAEPWDETTTLQKLTDHFNLLELSRMIWLCNCRDFRECLRLLLESESTHNPHYTTIERLLNGRDASRALSLIKKQQPYLGLALIFLKSLLEWNPKNAADFAVQSFPGILPRNMETHLRKSNPSLYMYYLSQLLIHHPHCKSTPGLLEDWFELSLSTSSPPKAQLFENGYPKRSAHKKEWENKDALINLIETPVWTDRRFLEKNCEKYGFFSGLTLIYLKDKNYKKVIDLMLCKQLYISFQKAYSSFISDLDDENTFDKLAGQPDFSLEHWHYLLEKRCKILLEKQTEKSSEKSQNKKENDEKSNRAQCILSKERIVHWMAHKIGAKKTLNLLNENMEFLEEIDPSVFQSILEASKISKFLKFFNQNQKSLLKTHKPIFSLIFFITRHTKAKSQKRNAPNIKRLSLDQTAKQRRPSNSPCLRRRITKHIWSPLSRTLFNVHQCQLSQQKQYSEGSSV